jgi:hypothetical protein
MVRHAPILLLALATFCAVGWLSNRVDDVAVTAHEASMGLHRAEFAFTSRKLYLSHVGAAISMLDREPGITVAQVRPVEDGIFEITCLHDPMARDPMRILLDEAGLPPERFRLTIKPYISADPALVIFRTETLLRLPPGSRATFEADTGTLTLSGEAPLGWIQQALDAAPFIPGVSRVSAKGLQDPREPRAAEILTDLDRLEVHFASESHSPAREDQTLLSEASERLAALERLALEMDVPVNVYLYGRSDRSPGMPLSPEALAKSRDLASRRAETVAEALRRPASTAVFRATGAPESFYPGPGPGASSHKILGLVVVRVILGNGRGLHLPDSGCPFIGPWGSPECPDAPGEASLKPNPPLPHEAVPNSSS